MSSEAIRQPLSGESLLQLPMSRRKAVLYLGAAAGVLYGKNAYDFGKEAYEKYQSVGEDYSNYPFFEAVGSDYLDRAQLGAIRAAAPDTVLSSERTTKEFQTQPEHLAEFTFFTSEPGPVHVQFDGLKGEIAALVVLQLSVNDGESFYVPIVRGPNQETPSEIQLGTHEAGEHRLSVALVDTTDTAEPEEITPRFVRGEPDTLRSYIDMHQPDIYLRNYSTPAHNIPLRSAVFVHQTEAELALVYWTECLGEDLVYGRFGTSVDQLITTKNRPTDWDWVMEALVDKETGALLLANTAQPYHNRVRLAIDPSYTAHQPLREASENNNVTPITQEDETILLLPKFRPRPKLYIHDDRKSALYQTGEDTAALSLREHYRRGSLDLSNPEIIHFLGTLGLDLASIKS